MLAWAAYAALVAVLAPATGWEAIALITVPLLALSWWHGPLAGVVAWFGAGAILLAFACWFGPFPAGEMLHHSPSLLAALVSVAAAGWAGGLMRRVSAQSAALAREVAHRIETEAALRTAQAELEAAVAQRSASLASEVSRRERVGERARGAGAHHRALLQNSSDIIFTASLDGRVRAVNPAAATILGYELRELRALGAADLLTPESRLLAQQAMAEQRRSGGEATYEVEARTRDGRLLHFDVKSQLLVRNGRPVAIKGIARDVTVHRQEHAAAEARLRLEEAVSGGSRLLLYGTDDSVNEMLALLGQAVEASRACIFRIDAVRETIGIAYEWCAPTTPSLLHVLSQLPLGVAPQWLDELKQGNAVVINGLVPLPDGWETPRAVLAAQNVRSLVAVPVTDKGELLGFIGFDDPSDQRAWPDDVIRLLRVMADAFAAWVARRRAEHAMRESEARLQTVLASIRTGVMVVDAETHTILDLNPEAERLTGRSRGELAGCVCHKVVCPAQHGRCPITDLGQTVDNSERILLSASGESVPILKSVVRAELAGRPVLVESVADLRPIKQLEAQLQQARQLESLGVLAGGIAHDFNNLLASIQGNADLLAVELPLDSPLQELIEPIETAVGRASDLTAQMLAYAGQARSRLEPQNLNELVKDLAVLGPSLAAKAAIRLELDQTLPLLEADAAQLGQIVTNLVTNAAESLEGATGTVTITTGRRHIDQAWLDEADHGTHLSPGEYAYLEVTDTGKGMDQETRARMFDPFFTTKFAGRGLGLSAVQGIVRSHRGAIRVTSTLGEGTTCLVILPLPASAAAEVEPARPRRELPEQWHGSGGILVIDDEDTVRKVACRMLSKAGYTPWPAGSGEEGLQLLAERAGEVAVILLDLTMPGWDGRETLERIRAAGYQTPVLLVSGYNQTEADHQFGGLHHDGWVRKPFNVATLLTAVRQATAPQTPAAPVWPV